MGFVSSMFGSGSGSGFQAQGVPINDPNQIDPRTNRAYRQADTGITQQAKFLQALAGQNGIGNQSSVFNQLQGVANGTGPNPAAAQLAQATGANVANQAALMASQRGANANAGLLARQAAQQGAGIQQQAAGQAATLQAQQSMNALGQLGSMAGQQVGQQQQALGQYNQAAQGQHSALMNSFLQAQGQQVNQQGNINSVNAGIAQGNQQAQQGLLGGAIGGVSSLLSLARGGTVPEQHLAAGGMASGPQSFIGRSANAGAAAPFNPIAAGLSTLGSGLRSSFFGTPAPAAPAGSSMSDYQSLPDLQNPGSNSFDYMNLPNAASQFTAEQAVSQPQMTAGIPSGTMMASEGGKVPGKPKVFGDSQVNDVVPAKLSPGEIVIPRSVIESDDPVRGAAEFVANELRKNSGAQKKMAAGGTAADDQGNSSTGGGSDSGKPPVVVNVNSSPLQQPQSAVPQNAMQSNLASMGRAATPILNAVTPKQGSSFAPYLNSGLEGVKSLPIGQPSAPVASTSPTDGLATGAGDAGTAQAPVNSDPYGYQSLSNAYKKGFGQQQAGIQQEAAATGALGKEQAAIEQQNQSRLAQLQQDYQQNYSKLDQERNAFQHDIDNSHIDPNKYVGNMDFGQKTKTAIGLILGGIGGGLLHQENPALKFLQSNIDRDIEAQKADLGKKENLLSMNMKQFGNLDQATNMTRLQQMTMVESQLKQAAAKAQDPMAKARAQQSLGVIQQAMAPLMQQMAMKNAALKGAASGNLDQSTMIKTFGDPKDQEALFKEAEKKQEIDSLKDFAKEQFNHLKGMTLNGALSPADRQSAIQSTVGRIQKITEGRYNAEAANNLAEALFPRKIESSNTTKLKEGRMDSLLEGLASTPRLDAFNKMHGYAPPKKEAAPEIQTMGGVKYQKAQGGWKRVS